MNAFSKIMTSWCVALCFGASTVFANTTPNQTDQISTIQPGSVLPFRVTIELANFQLPVGVHSGIFGLYEGRWILMAGRLNGLHGFSGDPFPPDDQNTSIYVVDPATGTVSSRALSDPSSGLSAAQIETLSATSPEGYQDGDTLYMVGGYGIDIQSGTYDTKSTITAINLPGIVQWVINPQDGNNSVIKNISQVSNPLFQVAGGRMLKLGNLMQLVFGQNYTGVYTPGTNGNYTQQVRQFHAQMINGKLSVDSYNAIPQNPDPNFRRRDLNVLPAILNKSNVLQYGLIAYSGVFTTAGGVWTVPVVIDSNGNPVMADPNVSATFKQGMNQYACASASLYSRKYSSLFHIFFGGASYGYYQNGVFETDEEIPFINDVTAVQLDQHGNFTQYIMDTTYPVILSTRSNPGNQLLFGAGAYFIPNNISHYPNAVINLDNIRQPTVIGYIVGGIQSTLPNTNTMSDSAASPYVFKVTLTPN
jgi:hypothetical protein